MGDGEKPIVGPVAVQVGEEAESRWLYVPRAFRLARISFDEREQRSSTLGLGDHLGPIALDRFVVQARVARLDMRDGARAGELPGPLPVTGSSARQDGDPGGSGRFCHPEFPAR